MKYLTLLFICFCVGCTSLDRDMVQSMDKAVQKVVPNYIEYVQKDKDISPELQKFRLQHAIELLKTIEDAKRLAGIETPSVK